MAPFSTECIAFDHITAVLLQLWSYFNEFAGFELRYSGTGREYVVENLEPGHSYGVRVAGVAADQQSEVSIVFSLYKMPDV